MNRWQHAFWRVLISGLVLSILLFTPGLKAEKLSENQADTAEAVLLGLTCVATLKALDVSHAYASSSTYGYAFDSAPSQLRLVFGKFPASPTLCGFIGIPVASNQQEIVQVIAKLNLAVTQIMAGKAFNQIPKSFFLEGR